MTINNKISKKHNLFKIIIVFFLIILILEIAIFGAYIFKEKGDFANAAIEMATDIVGKQDTIFCLFLGISEDTNTILTDSIILGGYNPNLQKAFMISIPRDTFIKDNSSKITSQNKINSLYKENPYKLIQAINEIFDLDIKNYVVINNKVLIDCVDILGGVEYDVPIDMNYDDITQNLHIHLKKGNQILDGKKTEQLVRFRHNNDGTTYSKDYGDNDFGRMKTQRNFIKAFCEKAISTKNISQIKEIVKCIFGNVQTNLSLKTIFSYIPYVMKYDINNLKMEQLPGKSTNINRIWFFEPDINKTKDVIKELLDFIEYNDSL